MFQKYSDTKFNENPSSQSRVVPCGHTDGRTDMTKLIVAFRSFADARKNQQGHARYVDLLWRNER